MSRYFLQTDPIDSIPSWESRSVICLYLNPLVLASPLAPWLLLFFVNVSTSHRGISWCSESYFSKPHSPLCCQHLYKGQVQCLRGVMLVSSPVRRSNEPSNQCYLFISQSQAADVVACGVTQASWGTLCGATSVFKAEYTQMHGGHLGGIGPPCFFFCALWWADNQQGRYVCRVGHQILLFCFRLHHAARLSFSWRDGFSKC